MKKFRIASTIYGTTARVGHLWVDKCAIAIEGDTIDAMWDITRTKYTYIYEFGIRETNLKESQHVPVLVLIISGFML